jgi:hypothetical protein
VAQALGAVALSELTPPVGTCSRCGAAATGPGTGWIRREDDVEGELICPDCAIISDDADTLERLARRLDDKASDT